MMRGLDRFCPHLRALRHDVRGVAAVEFAFLAPILILFYFGMVEF